MLLQEEGLSQQCIAKIEELDSIRMEGILHADKKCRKLKMGQIPWSPELRDSINKIRYFRACCLKFGRHERQIGNRRMLRLFLRSKEPEKIFDYETASTRLRQEFLHYNTIKASASEIRLHFLEDLAATKALTEGLQRTTVLKQLLLREKQRELGRKVKFIQEKKRVGLTIAEIPDNDGVWTIQTEKEVIERGCMQENIARFTQANQTPSLLPDQVDLLGWTGNGLGSDDLLQGNNNPAFHPAITALAPFLSTPPAIQLMGDISSSISATEFRREWRKCKEFTSSGPSTLHFGHFKASCSNDVTTEADRWFSEISLLYGYSLTRWHKGIDVMIPKKEDSVRVDKLRTIVLVEADFNFLNKLVAKRAMIQAEEADTIAGEQFGSRKRKSSIIHATNKLITTDILRQRKQNHALLILDAKACYDRISPPIAAISLRRQGVPANATNMMFSTLDKMEHTIRTSFGDSVESYKREETQFHGVLQGNGAGPVIWAMVSSPILQNLKHQGFGTTLISPFSNNTLRIAAFAFVDDTDLLQDIPSDHANITTKPQQAVNAWEEGLRTTSDALVPSKCCWFGMIHSWENNKWQWKTCTDSPGDITIRSDDGIPITIQRLEPTESVLSLGLQFSPSGDMGDELEYLITKGTRWADQVRSGGLNRAEAWYMLTSVVMKTIEFPLLATTFSKKQLDQVMQPILKVGLPKAGICRNMGRDAIYSSKKFLGFGINHPYTILREFVR
jgi:Reverse transcriptase (RNA-dependent DNA polymerase)